MRIGGLEKQSLIDWEGKVAAVIFTKGCNFRCTYCHNPSLVYPALLDHQPDIPVADVLQYLKSRKEWLDGVVITGGEPSLHTDLVSFIKSIKALNLKVKIDTNGSNPKLLKKLLSEELVDFVAMDIKTLLIPELYDEICGIETTRIVEHIQSSLAILRSGKIAYQLRTTVFPKHHNSKRMATLKEQFFEENYSLQAYRKPL